MLAVSVTIDVDSETDFCADKNLLGPMYVLSVQHCYISSSKMSKTVKMLPILACQDVHTNIGRHSFTCCLNVWIEWQARKPYNKQRAVNHPQTKLANANRKGAKRQQLRM